MSVLSRPVATQAFSFSYRFTGDRVVVLLPGPLVRGQRSPAGRLGGALGAYRVLWSRAFLAGLQEATPGHLPAYRGLLGGPLGPAFGWTSHGSPLGYGAILRACGEVEQ